MADAAQVAGRGVIYIALAKLYFMVAGYAIYFTLPRLLGSEVLWGNYLLVVGLVSVIDNVIVTGTIQGVSKFTAQDDALAQAVKRAALRVQLVLGGGITAIYLLAAPWIAAWEIDASLTPLYRLSAGIMFCYAFYAVFVGSLNGLRRFGRQATLDASFATLRASLILGFAGLGWGVFGAIGGFVSAAALILLASAAWVGLPRGDGQRFETRLLWQFMLKLFVYTLSLNLIMRVDLFLIKRLTGPMSGAADAAARASAASAQAGYYGTAQSLAFIPYQAILAVAFVIFPLVSRSTFAQDLESTRTYIRQTLRFSLVFVAGVAVVFMANPEAVINVPYEAKYRVGGAALQVLAAGMVCFSMFTIINTILNGAGRPNLAILSGVVTLAAAAAGNALLIPTADSPLAALRLAALASSGAMALGMLLSGTLLYRAYGATVPPLSVLRILLAMAAALALGRVLPEVSRLVTVAECVGVFASYFAVLLLLREFGASDLAGLRRVFGRRGRGG
jgi:stage V sporulation protein B